jgi:salicylate hydroxylase
MSSAAADVGIVGAGLGGLTLALALAKLGGRATVYEAAPALGEVGAGITVSPNAGRVLDWLGLGDAVRAHGVQPHTQRIQHWATGELLREMDRGAALEERYAAPYRHLHRADLHAMLADALEAAQPGAIRLGAAVAGADADGTIRFAGGGAARHCVVVGADGVKSAVRSSLFGGDTPVFTGQVAWRGLVARADLPAAHRDAPPGIHIGPGRLFLRYPVRAGALINYAAFVELQGWEEESWSIPSTPHELLGHFAGCDPLIESVVRATPEGRLFKWALHAREPLDRWVAGRVTLLGDAAHAMLPFLGQGAATAIEDGMVLARCLAGFAPDEALARYVAARRERCAMIQLQSRLVGLQFQGRDPEALGRGPLRNEEALGLFNYDAVTAPV